MSIGDFVEHDKVGPFAIQDSGAPIGGSDYKTLVILHGFAWTSGERYRLTVAG